MYKNVSNNLLHHDLYDKVASYIAKHLHLVLAFSGGMDSTVLLSIIADLYYRKVKSKYIKDNFKFRVVHINHKLNVYADSWALHCFQQCKNLNIPFSIIKLMHTTNKNNIGIEATVRFLRNQALFASLKTKEILLTAHHLDDQVETFFLALKRGSGPTGLSSMSLYSKYNSQLLRPLLSFTRLQLQKYAYDYDLSWIEDNSNKDINFDRNFLRICTLPLFSARWSFFSHAVIRSIHIYSEQENLLDQLLLNKLSSMITIDGSLLLKSLIKMTIQMRHALLRRWLKLSYGIQCYPSYKQLDCIWKEVILSRRDATPILRFNNYLISRFQNRLYVIPLWMSEVISNLKLCWSLMSYPILLPYNLGVLIAHLFNDILWFYKDSVMFKKNMLMNLLNYYLIYFNKEVVEDLIICFVRCPNSNENVSVQFGIKIPNLLHIVGRDKGRTFKKILQDFGIPPWLRNRIPLLFYNNQLIAAIGVFITKEGKVKSQENQYYGICWLQNSIIKFFNKNKQKKIHDNNILNINLVRNEIN